MQNTLLNSPLAKQGENPPVGGRGGWIYKLMRITFIQATITMTLCGVAMAGSNYGQGILDKLVTIKLKETTLKQTLKGIEQQVPVKFSWSGSLINLDDKITIDVKEKTLREVLNALLVPRSIAYAVEDREEFIILSAKKDETSSVPISDPVKEQEPPAPITGKVTSSDGSPLPGVNVIVKGTTKGRSTDAEGMYTIDANEGDLLVFSFIGYKTFETQVSGRTVIDIALEEDISTLNEIIVNAGYYQVKDKDQTGNISRITAEDIQKQPVSNPLQALIGRMPGVYIQQSSGVPGSNINLQIRGRNSVRPEGNNPLYIVDGVPFTSNQIGTGFSVPIIGGGSPLSNINPSDIESIEVLKDADATAIYGSRGSNGVVLITTKKGKKGKTEVDINFYRGIGRIASKMDLLNTQQYLEMRHEAFANDELAPGTYSPDYDLLKWDTTRYTDWQKEMIGGTANITSTQVSISGGNENTQFLFGGGYYKETSVFPSDFADKTSDFADKKYSTRFSINHISNNQRFTADFSGNYLRDENNLLYADLTAHALTLPPNAPAAYTADGKLNWENGNWDYNPYAILQQKYQAKTGTLRSDAVVGYRILKDLQIKTSLGYTEINFDEHTEYPTTSFNPAWGITQGFATFANSKIQTWIAEPQLNYQAKLGQGTLSTLIGLTFQQTTNLGQILRATGFGSDALLNNLQSASNVIVFSSTNSVYKYNAGFARVNYDWRGKYIANLTARRDGSSRFGSGNRFGNFGAIGAAWIFSNEGFLKDNLFFLSFGKIRASYGTTGNDQIGDYGFYDLWNSSAYNYAGIRGLYPKSLYNSDYAWEVNKKFEAGLEVGLIKDRIFLGVSYYRNSSSNQLVGYSVPRTTGFSTIQANLPAEIQNTGVELEVSTINIETSDLSWKTSLNVTLPRNKLVSYPNLESSSYRYLYEVGQPLGIVKAFHYTGIDPQTGIHTFEDVDGNGNGTDYPADFQMRKKIAQSFYGGLQNTFTFHGFQVDVFFQFVKQTGWNYLTGFTSQPGTMSNQPIEVLNRWQKPGDITNIQKFSQGYDAGYSAYSNIASSDRAVSDASFIRLKTLSLSYTIPTNWSKKVKLETGRIFIQGQNLITFTNYLGMDPESQNMALPPLRIITTGIQLTF